MIRATCAFGTNRLLVRDWHSFDSEQWPARDLARFVAALMTAPVTHALPPDWQGDYTRERALAWIESRDAEGPTLLVVERASERAIGVVVLFETECDDGRVDVRLGYLLVESVWRQGFASELVEGFVGWCREQATIRSIAGGVERGNVASARVLEKAGFRRVEAEQAETASEQVFEIRPNPR